MIIKIDELMGIVASKINYETILDIEEVLNKDTGCDREELDACYKEILAKEIAEVLSKKMLFDITMSDYNYLMGEADDISESVGIQLRRKLKENKYN